MCLLYQLNNVLLIFQQKYSVNS